MLLKLARHRIAMMYRRFRALLPAFVLAAAYLAPPASGMAAPAATRVPPPPREENPKILRYVSLRVSKANLRQGPSYSHRILWIYRHKGYPFAVINEFDSWRKLLTPDGSVGWMSSVMLSDRRTVLVTGKGRVPIHAKAGGDKVIALADPGAVAELEACAPAECRISGGNIDGWISKARIWGVGKDEVFEK